MCNYKVIYEVSLFGFPPTGNTKHYVQGVIAPIPCKLQIVKHNKDDGCYLLYLTNDNEEITDTYHENTNNAMEQANWEFGVQAADWKIGTN